MHLDNYLPWRPLLVAPSYMQDLRHLAGLTKLVVDNIEFIDLSKTFLPPSLSSLTLYAWCVMHLSCSTCTVTQTRMHAGAPFVCCLSIPTSIFRKITPPPKR